MEDDDGARAGGVAEEARDLGAAGVVRAEPARDVRAVRHAGGLREVAERAPGVGVAPERDPHREQPVAAARAAREPDALRDAGGDPAAYPAIADFSAQWPTMFGDFNAMVDKMQRNIDNYEAADALPSFSLFPWFFLVPGLLVAGTAIWALRRRQPDEEPTPPTSQEAQPS